jgi:DNA-binding beta-propeller fold protein YncE
MQRNQKVTLFAVAILSSLLTPISHAADTFKWSVQYLVDQSQVVFGKSQKIWPRRNRGLAISPDGKYLYVGYLHGVDGSGEVRKIAIGITEDYARATVHAIQGPLGKAVACDDKGRVYIANGGEILVYDANLDKVQHTIPMALCEGVCATREGRELVLYASDRQLGLLQRWVLEEKGDNVVGSTPAGLDGNGQVIVKGASSLRGVEVDPRGNIWIADHDAGLVFRVSKDGRNVDSTNVEKPMDIAFDGSRAYVSRGVDRQITVMETDTLKLIGNLAVPWDELELTPTGNNRNGALSGIISIPGKGFIVSNESGQTANQKSAYGRADEMTDFVGGKLYRDAFNDDNDPLLRALEIKGE